MVTKIKQHYKGKARQDLRLKVEKLRDKGMQFNHIGDELGISSSLASTLYKEAKTSPSLSMMDRLKLWLTFRV